MQRMEQITMKSKIPNNFYWFTKQYYKTTHFFSNKTIPDSYGSLHLKLDYDFTSNRASLHLYIELMNCKTFRKLEIIELRKNSNCKLFEHQNRKTFSKTVIVTFLKFGICKTPEKFELYCIRITSEKLEL